MKICPNCQIEFDDSFMLCDQCGSTLQEAAGTPVKEKGFWSVTAYGEDDFLIENPIDRYAVSDRTSFEKNEDGSVDIYIQKDEPKGHKANWLPVSGDGFHLFLRVYRPEDSPRRHIPVHAGRDTEGLVSGRKSHIHHDCRGKCSARGIRFRICKSAGAEFLWNSRCQAHQSGGT